MPSANNVVRPVIFAASFLQRNFDSQNHSFSISVKTTDIDHIAVLADSNKLE